MRKFWIALAVFALSFPASAQNVDLQILNMHEGLFVVGSRQLPIIKGALNNGQTTYANNQNIGGLITISTGLQPGTVIGTLSIKVKVLDANVTTIGSVVGAFFDANPTASTITDGANISINSADFAKLVAYSSVSATAPGNTIGLAFYYNPTASRIQVDGNGNVYIAINATNAITYGGTNVLLYEVDGLY